MARETVTFYFDPVCPWTWNTSRWLVEVAQRRGLTIDWRPLSLAVLNAGRDVPEEYRAPMEVGHATLRVVAALRAAGRGAEIRSLYTEVGRRIFRDQAPASMALVAAATAAVGLGARP